MKASHQVFTEEFEGQTLQFEFGKFAGQANGSVVAKMGDTIVLATATIGKHDRIGIDYFPLMVDYEEKFYAAGRILGSRFVKREGRPSEEAILTARLIDRSIRPLFDHSLRKDVQVVVTVLSVDSKNDPDIIALLAASLALSTSDIPWGGPIGAVRIGKNEHGFVINPEHEARKQDPLDLVIAGTKDKVNMIEAGAREIPETDMLAALEFGLARFKQLVELQERIVEKVGRTKMEIETKEKDGEFEKKVREFIGPRLEPAVFSSEKQERMDELDALKGSIAEMLKEAYPDDADAKFKEALHILDSAINDVVHEHALKSERRPDGRKIDELRTISAEVGLLPRAHGSALFNRGQTQSLSVLTLGAPGDKQLIEGMEVALEKRFMLHYNFPPYSVGEISPMRGPGRREIGHGALAEKALAMLVPEETSFPYTIRLVSEILSSNGSSSMASVCAGSLAMMDGGVPIKPAAGIALGLMSDGTHYKVLTDIQGPEDHHGDMDFKAAGTREGLTAMQMDVKIEGVTLAMLRDALAQAKKARFEILDTMQRVIDAPRETLSPFAPRIHTLQIHPDKIREVIGPQGKVINEITKETGVSIDIEDSGMVFVTAPNEEAAEKALARINSIVKEIEIGDVFEGTVARITDFGAFIDLTPNKDGLLRNEDSEGETIEQGVKLKVRVREIDNLRRINLELADRPPRPAGPPRGGFGDRPRPFGRGYDRRPPPRRRF